LAQVKRDFEQRRAELAKLSTLQDRIESELPVLNRKMESMVREMNEFKTPEEIREEAEVAKKVGFHLDFVLSETHRNHRIWPVTLRSPSNNEMR